MIKKILKWTGIVLLLIIVGATVLTASRQNLTYEAPYPDIKASKDSAIIARGRHIVISSGHCVDCHSKPNADSILKLGQEVSLTGGVEFDLPVGKIYSKNITSDPETGIGKYTDAEIARALRYGVHPDGTVVFDFMPFHNTSDEDMTAIISYIRTQKPIKHKVPEHELNTMGKIVKAFMVKPAGPVGEVPKSVKQDTTAEYGKYIAYNLAECNGCHTNRDMTGAFIGEPFAGGPAFEEKTGTYFPPNLTSDSSSRIFAWTEKNFIDRFRMGKIVPGTPMPWQSYGRMTDDELKAIYRFLKSTKPVRTVPREHQLALK